MLSKDDKRRIYELIEAAEVESASNEQVQRNQGKLLFNGHLARMRTPISSLKYGTMVQETVMVFDDQDKLAITSFGVSETRFLDSRRQWNAYQAVTKLLLERCLSEQELQGELHRLFKFTYGTMAICRRYDQGESYLLMGIRGAKIGTLNSGKASFPAGMVNPNEPIQWALLRELTEESGIDQVAFYPGFSTFRFSNACSMTFSALGVTRSRKPIAPCYEVKGGLFVWVPEAALQQKLKGEHLPFAKAFTEAGIEILEPERLEVTEDGASTYHQLSRIYPS